MANAQSIIIISFFLKRRGVGLLLPKKKSCMGSHVWREKKIDQVLCTMQLLCVRKIYILQAILPTKKIPAQPKSGNKIPPENTCHLRHSATQITKLMLHVNAIHSSESLVTLVTHININMKPLFTHDKI